MDKLLEQCESYNPDFNGARGIAAANKEWLAQGNLAFSTPEYRKKREYQEGRLRILNRIQQEKDLDKREMFQGILEILDIDHGQRNE